MTQLFFIRHGQSTNNALADPTQRVQDPELTELGQIQAERVAEYLAANRHLKGSLSNPEGPPLERLYCSAMVRAVHTATPIGQALGLRPEVYVDLHEIGGIYLDYPDGRTESFPGQTRSELSARFPDCLPPDTLDEAGWWRGGRENEEEALQRASKVADKLLQRTDDESRIGLVTHGDFMSHLIKALIGAPQGKTPYLYHCNTAITCVELSPDKGLTLRYINRIEHLEENYVTSAMVR